MYEDWKNDSILKAVLDEIGPNYLCIKYLGGGGFSSAYLVKHKIFDEQRVLKVMDFEYISRGLKKANGRNAIQKFDEITSRFVNEARVYEKILHPCVIKMHDVGVARDKTKNVQIPYLIMDYIEGKTLKETLRDESSLDMKTVFKVSENILSALDTIHKRGIIHRDIKPSNIMIKERNGEAVLIDFGLAKDLEVESVLTITGTVMGTAHYMAPEMFDRSKDVSIEADIYSFGAVLFEMLTGETPFQGSFFELMHEHFKTPVPETPVFKDFRFGKRLYKVIKNAMAKEAKNRYRSALEFSIALKEIEKDEPSRSLSKYLIYLSGIIALVAFISIDPFGIIKKGGKGNNSDIKYKEYIASANNLIETGDLQKAIESLHQAKEIKDSDEIKQLLETIATEKMERDFEALKEFLKGGAGNPEKMEECREFLNKHKKVPKNNETRLIVSETNKFLAQLNAKIDTEKQYKSFINSVKRYIDRQDYERAEYYLNKAKKIKKDTKEVRELSKTIKQKQMEMLEFERKNGKKDYDAIKGNIDHEKYLKFIRKYPGSIYLLDLKNNLKVVDKALPPEKHLNRQISKSERGYYEFTFKEEHNGHLMIYIPKKKIWIDKYEVSWAQFKKFLSDQKIPIPTPESDEYIGYGEGFPAVVTYEEAEKYCKRYGLRLPTAAEWEYAAGKGRFTYPWGNESPDVPDANGQWRANLDTLDGDRDKDGYKGTAPVKSFEKFSSPFGVVNMAGNVWEWIRGKVLKGGGYLSQEDDLVVKNVRQADSLDKEGFRCVKDEK